MKGSLQKFMQNKNPNKIRLKMTDKSELSAASKKLPNKKSKKNYRWYIFFLLCTSLIVLLSYLWRQNYFSCLLLNPVACMNSKFYQSKLGLFSFRYPEDYPITYITGDELKQKYLYDSQIQEWVNFSKEFYLSAGGDRLGTIIVENEDKYQDIEDYLNQEINDYELTPEFVYRTIDGKKAVCLNIKSQPHCFGSPQYHCAILYQGNIYKIDFFYNDSYHKMPVDYYQRSRDLILSTFKFE